MSIQYYNLTTHQRDVVIDIQTSLAALKYKVDELQSSGSTISLSIPATQLTWSNPNTGDTLTIQQALELIKVQVSLLENTPLSATDISCINSNSQTSDLQTQLNSLYQHQTLKFHIMQSSIPTTIMYSITYGNHIFVAVGANGMIFRTLTVHVWRSRASNVLKRLTSVTYGNGMFVAVGDNGSITTSSSTVTWANHTINSTYNYTNIIYANGMFVIVGNSGRIVTSVDGKTWTEQTSTVSDDLSSIVLGNGLFVCVGNNGTIITSSNSSTLAKQTTNTTGSFNKIIYGKGMFVTVGDGGIFSSQDGFTWALRSSELATKITYYGNNLFVGVELNSKTFVMSSDGITWEVKSSGVASWYGIAYGNNWSRQ